MKNLGWISLFVAVLFVFGCSSNQGGENVATSAASAETPDASGGQSLVDDDSAMPNVLKIAIGSADHTTLVAAVQAAGIQDVLANNGPLTVFAPTNAAFDALPEGTVDNLLKPENKSALINVLYYHAAPGTYKDDLLTDGRQIYEANGDNVEIKRNGDEVTVNGAKILATVEASNGVVHVIDKVLLPPEK